MRRILTFAAAWLFAAIAATTAAWQGVALVTHEVTDQRAPALGASEVEAKLADGPSGSITTTTPSDTGAGDDPTSSSTTTAPRTTSSTTSPSTTRPAPTTTAPPSEDQTFTLVGGTTTLRFSPAGVTQVTSQPKPGFGYKSEPEGTGIRVEFESEGHRSRIDAWWDNGPQHRIREDDG